MRIQIASDLHLEFEDRSSRRISKKSLHSCLDINENVDVLILAGDVWYMHKSNFKNVIKEGLDFAEHVIFVPGNHDFWGSNLLDINKLKDNFANNNVHILYNDFVTIKGKEFFGGTMWANPTLQQLEFMKRMLADFTYIRGFNPYSIISKWENFVLGLAKGNPDVVISHFAAFPGSIHKKYENNFLSSYFCTNMAPYVPSNTKLWVHGHVHDSFDYVTNFGLRVVCNPRGYEGCELNHSYTKDCIVEI